MPGSSRVECVKTIHEVGAKVNMTGMFLYLFCHFLQTGVSAGVDRTKYAMVSQNMALNQNRVLIIRNVG